MKNPYQITQGPVGAERNFVVIRHIIGVATVNFAIAEGRELGVKVVFGGKRGKG